MNIFNTYFFYYIYYLLSGRKNSILIKFFRKKGISIGDKCHIYSNILSPEPYLVTIKNEVTIAPGCRLITHDNSVCKLNINSTDVFGKIEIGNNCFIGANSVILPGVVISDNTIVAAGAVVTKSFPPNVVIGGNPARILTTIDKYRSKIAPYCLSVENLSFMQKKELVLNSNQLITK